MVALVGARNASSLGTRMARVLAEGLGLAGYSIVSGLARGIDTAAHQASLKTGTIAVMGGGVDVIYPAENAVLAAAVSDQGLRLSEQPMGTYPQARHFPPRNRIIAGLSMAVIVVEAAEKSGTLITVKDALEQGREVMAVPGHPVDGRAGGCNRLIREGATLVRNVEDVLDVLERIRPAPDNTPTTAATTTPQAPHAVPTDVSALNAAILRLLGPTPIHEDMVIRDMGLSAAVISPALVALELDGSVQRHPGGLISRA
jgi:DNA processing protein